MRARGLRLTAFLLGVSVVAASVSSFAQEHRRPGPPAAAARPAAPPAMARPAPPPAMARPAPPPAMARPAAPAFRPAPPPQRPAMAPRPMPQIAAPPRPAAPRMAAPSRPSAPPSPSARPPQQEQTGQREQGIHQRQQTTQQELQRDMPSRQSVQRQEHIDRLQQRVQQLKSQQPEGPRAQRAQQRLLQTEQRQLQREQRVQQLQQTAQERQRDMLSRQGVQRQDRIDGLQQRVQQLQSQQPEGLREQRAQQRLLETQQRLLRHEERLQQRNLARQQQLGIQPSAARPATAAAVQAAARGRFAARFASADPQAEGARAARHHGWAPRHAWRRGLRAAFVPWAGHVFWPYAYSDIFEYTFWPYAYDPGYWAYAYDDFVDTVFWGVDSPYSAYARLAPTGYPESDGATTGARPRERSDVSQQDLSQLCGDPDKGITAWPIASIEQAVQPTPEQRALLNELKSAAAKAADAFKESCGGSYAMTPPGRLRAMTNRISATLEAVRIVRPALEKFYNSLSDEQQARFNALGPNVGERSQPQQEANAQSDTCGEPKSGLTQLPIERMETVIRPAGPQKDALDRLSAATEKAIQELQAACPDDVPLTPVGRLEAMQKRLEAMMQAANLVQPALDEFYAALSSEQKARFNALGRFAGP
jgi:LTXXQ motif family protein